MRFLAAVVILAALGSACGKKPRQPTACKQNADCAGGWICLAEMCRDPSEGALYADPGHAATPAAVKQELEHQSADEQKRLDDMAQHPLDDK